MHHTLLYLLRAAFRKLEVESVSLISPFSKQGIQKIQKCWDQCWVLCVAATLLFSLQGNLKDALRGRCRQQQQAGFAMPEGGWVQLVGTHARVCAHSLGCFLQPWPCSVLSLGSWKPGSLGLFTLAFVHPTSFSVLDNVYLTMSDPDPAENIPLTWLEERNVFFPASACEVSCMVLLCTLWLNQNFLLLAPAAELYA